MDATISLAIPYFYIAHLLLISMRVGAALLMAPIWGHAGIPQQMRILLIFTISAGVASITPFSPKAYENPGLVIPTEILIGMLLSMGIRIAFAGLHMAGQFISYHLGYSSVQLIDPQTQNRSNMMSVFLTLFGYMMILTTDQHHNILRAISASYTTFPIGTVVQSSQWFEALMQASSQIFVIGWKIALPVFVATFLVELTVGLISRMQPQINAMVVTAPLKLLLGLSVFGASLAFLPRAVGAIMDSPILRK
jgi:flagellar biosynthetic protein FliR